MTTPDHPVPVEAQRCARCGMDRCAVQDCPNPIETWMVTEVAPGRPIVYGVCERDMALIHMAEMPQ